MAHTTAHNESGAASNEMLETSRAPCAARVNVPQGTRRANALAHDQSDGGDQSPTTLLSKLCNSRLLRVLNKPCGLIGMLNFDEGVTHVNNKSKILQR